MIPRGVSFFILKFEYLSENQTKIENILTHWSVAQAGSNGELNWRLKISLDCPFKVIPHTINNIFFNTVPLSELLLSQCLPNSGVAPPVMRDRISVKAFWLK